MLDIAFVNYLCPDENQISYFSQKSLRDFDLIVFDPSFPHHDLNRVYFGGGGSCIDIDTGKQLVDAMSHWQKELKEALRAGKTVFILLGSSEVDRIASGYHSKRKGERTYETANIFNYDALPTSIALTNAEGAKFKISDRRFALFADALKNIVQYQVILETDVKAASFVTKDGTGALGRCLRFEDLQGHLVLLPYFQIYDKFYNEIDEEWSSEATIWTKRISQELAGLLRILASEVDKSPAPSWALETRLPSKVLEIEKSANSLKSEIECLQSRIDELDMEAENYSRFVGLQFEQGKQLEHLVEAALALLGYSVENYQNNDLEIDHIIVSPEGFRMVGETEGKDSSAVSISKFRQLETNINEDFDRDEVAEPAKGVLFGNGYRLRPIEDRDVEFTDKCLTNAKRLGTALVRTSDLYDVVRWVLDNPTDEAFKARCRAALERTAGEIVEFPDCD